MGVQLVLIEPGFSTADASRPTFDYSDREYLQVIFDDWREEQVVVLFREVVAVKWQTAESLSTGERDDSSYEVLNSPWLAVHREQGLIEASSDLHHYKFNFNAVGELEVLCAGFRIEGSDKSQQRFWNK